VEFRIGGNASVRFRVGGHARWLWPLIVADKSISARIALARGSTFGGSVVIRRSRTRLFFYGFKPKMIDAKKSSFTNRSCLQTVFFHVQGEFDISEGTSAKCLYTSRRPKSCMVSVEKS